jgi:hypothetical protein
MAVLAASYKGFLDKALNWESVHVKEEESSLICNEEAIASGPPSLLGSPVVKTFTVSSDYERLEAQVYEQALLHLRDWPN